MPNEKHSMPESVKVAGTNPSASVSAEKAKTRNPHDGHRERMRMLFLRNGAENMEPHQVLEMLLHNVIPRCDTNEIAHRLIERFGSFSGVLDARLEDLAEVKGLGMKSAVFLKMIPGISRVYINDKYQNGRTVRSMEDIGDFLLHLFAGCTNERFYMVCMDRTCRIQQTILIDEGTMDSVMVDTRKVVEAALSSRAAGIVLAHNHPQGFAIPSDRDVATTIRLVEGLAVINVAVYDHIIVADNDYVSLAQSKQYRNIFQPHRRKDL